jgi:hypothetical protein
LAIDHAVSLTRQRLLDALVRDAKPRFCIAVAMVRRLLPAFCIRRIASSALRSLSSGSSDPSAAICQPNGRLPPRKRPRLLIALHIGDALADAVNTGVVYFGP